MSKKYLVKEISEGGVIQSQNEFDSFEDLKTHLVATDYFGWINENEPEKELPNFEEVETVSDIESIFEEYDYSYWTMTIEVEEVMETAKCTLLENGRVAIDVVVEDGELYFLHPMTNQRCNSVDQCLYGWSDENLDDWVTLVEEIKNDDMLVQKIVDGLTVIEY